jgi:hypothetical protein
LALLLVTSLALYAATAQGASTGDAIPRALTDWQQWVLKGLEYHRCPFLAGGDSAPDEAAYHCAWPERLQLAVDARGGRFSQQWQVYSDSWIALPGDLAHWPDAVQLDGHPAPVVARDDVPSLWLTPGTHEVNGRWSWDVRPETLSIPHETALLDLSVDGARIAQPERPNEQVALGRQESAVEPRELQLQIYRLLEYDEPVRLETRLRIRAAGDAREESLGQVLPEGFVPLSLESSLPARLDRDGTLRVQVRPGAFELTLIARQAAALAALRMPQAGSRVSSEVWSFSSNDQLGVATLEGAPGVDPSQAQVPQQWRKLPAFELAPDSQLHLTERTRGLSDADHDRLRLSRELWLDFDHQGWTVRDQLTGTLRREWRLDVRAPYQLESARADGDTLLVTGSQEPETRGVELRAPRLALTAISRIAHPFSMLPATGWTSSFESVSGLLYLPPGHRLLAVLGADESPTAWLDRWGLWNLFGVLVVIVFARWVAGWKTATVAAAGLLLSCQGEALLLLGWGNLLAAIALARAASSGRLAGVALAYRTVSFVLLALILVPFAWTEARNSIYPQLEHAAVTATGGDAQNAGVPADVLPSPNQPAGALQRGYATPTEKNQSLEEVVVTGSQRSQSLGAGKQSQQPWQQQALSKANASYAPGTNVQAGPGVPSWSYGTHVFGWSGPVDPSQTVQFIVLGPVAVAAWRLTGVALLAAFLIQLLRLNAGSRKTGTGLPRAAAAVLLLISALALAPAGHAQGLPDPKLLEQLRNRLVEPPHCVPSCAELLSARIHIEGERMTAELHASALARLAISAPSAGYRWQVDAVTVDGVSSLAVTRDADTGLWVPLEPGVHTVRIEGRLFGESIHLAFPMTPRQISVDAPGWTAGGINAGGLLSGALDLTRAQPARDSASGSEGADSQEFPAFVHVIREFQLGLDWAVATKVERVSPSEAAFTVVLPLIPGESVLTEGLKVNADSTALVGLASGETAREWSSSLNRSDTLSVRLPALPARSEVWRFVVNPQWHVVFRGLPAVLPEAPSATPWVFEYRPRPGEGLDLTVTQPPPVAGTTLAIDRALHLVRIGRRSSDETIDLQYRSTQGGRQMISLPRDATVTRIAVDGEPVPIRPENGELALSVLPGQHSVEIAWRSMRGEEIAGMPASVDLHAPASNVRTTLSLPRDRWPLFAAGEGVGPAFLYWGELLIFLAVAIVLARSRFSPLKTGEWLLLGLGLSTLSWTVLLVVAAWLFAMCWRERTSLAWRPLYFNLLQVLLAGLTVVAVLTLVFSGVRYGLLSSPKMGVRGPGSYGNTFTWFIDHTTSGLPLPTVYSVPLWIYRVIMFVWALWIALALARWLRFAWRAWNTGGYWRGRETEGVQLS